MLLIGCLNDLTQAHIAVAQRLRRVGPMDQQRIRLSYIDKTAETNACEKLNDKIILLEQEKRHITFHTPCHRLNEKEADKKTITRPSFIRSNESLLASLKSL